MASKTIRRSITMTPEMHNRLLQLASRQPRDITEVDLIREAIRLYLDNQEDLLGSRRHFQKSLQDSLKQLETTLTFHLNVLLYLLTALHNQPTTDPVYEAIIAARRDGDMLLAQIRAVRDMQ